MDDIAVLTHQLEYEFLKTIIHDLRDSSITVPEAKQLAQDFLALEPFESEDDASTKINNFCQSYGKFSLLKVYMDSYDKERGTTKKINDMRKLIKENNFDEALDIAKK